MASSKAVEKFPKEAAAKWTDNKKREILKPWHTVACVRHWMNGESTAQIARDMGKGATTLTDLFKSPAAVRLRDFLDKELQDPVELAKSMAKANSLGVTMDWYMALEWAKEARDYRSVAQMTKDLAALGGVQAIPPKQEIETSKTIRIVFEGDSLDTKTVEAEWEEVNDEDDDL